MKPSICVWLITRNEERDIPRALRSVESFADHVVIVDTGSSDNTQAVAKAAIKTPMTYEVYTDASERGPDGNWRIANFSKARNRAIELAEATECTHLFWIDSDDEVTTPLAMRRIAYMPNGVWGCWIELGGGVRQVHYRAWDAGQKIRFHGYVHEWPDISKRPQSVLNDACIVHDATAHESSGETSNERNLRILTAQYAAEPDARTAFYIANTHKDGGRWDDAIKWYDTRIDYGEAFRDECMFAYLYRIRCLRRTGRQGDVDLAAQSAERMAVATDWQEFRMELAFIAYDRGDWAKCIEEATKALDKPIPQTVLWREPQMYRDQPARLISWCHEHLGNKAQALVWSQLATRLIGQHDEDWSRREARLESIVDADMYKLGPNAVLDSAPAIVKGLRRMVALHRPGAIGDILMTLNLLPAFKEANPDTDVHYFCSAGLASMDALGGIILAAGANAVMDCAHLPQWRKRYDRTIDLIGYPLAEGYPERPMKRHLLQYFADEMRIPRLNGNGALITVDNGQELRCEDLPSLTLRRPKRPAWWQSPPREYATIQMHAGWSKYKQWSKECWIELEETLDIPVVEIDEAVGHPLSEVIALFANARMHIGIDSFCNHLTNYYWTDEHGGRRVPGVILWGSTQASAAGYPGNTNISKGLTCQPCFRESPKISRMPRGPCINPPRPTYDDDTPHKCMQDISVDEVVEAVRAMWSGLS